MQQKATRNPNVHNTPMNLQSSQQTAQAIPTLKPVAVKMNILEIGIEQGEDRLAQLLQFLKNDGRHEDADRAIFDPQYREQLYQEYQSAGKI